MTAFLRHPEGLEFKIVSEEKMYIILPSGNIYLGFKPISVGYNTEIEGRVEELQLSINSENVTHYTYIFSGGKIEDTTNLPPINWKRKYEYEQDEIDAEFEYSFHRRKLNIKLSRHVSTDSLFYQKIDNDIKDEVLFFLIFFPFVQVFLWEY